MKFRKIIGMFLVIGVLGITGCESEKKEETVPVEEKEEVRKESEEEEAEDTAEVTTEDTAQVTTEDTAEDAQKQFLLGTWGNETALSEDDTMKFSMAYYTEFKEDGTVEQQGYRNMDSGTYKYLDENTVEAVFDHNVFQDAANPEDLDPIEGYVYQVTYYLDREAGTIEAKYSQEFFDALISNATDGILKKVD